MRKKDFCIGCGACKFACPQKCVKLQEDVLGRYEMVIAKEQCLECGITIAKSKNSRPKNKMCH